MTKQLRTTLVTFEQFSDLDFVHPSTYYIKLATGDFLYFHTNDRKLVKEYIDKEYDGIYAIRASKMIKPKGLVEGFTVTCRA
jgi:hypothetical protein